MANIVSKLNLNKTPNTVENNSLVFAKNIKLLADGSIGRDYGFKKLNINLPNLSVDITAELNKLLTKKNEYESQISYYTQLLENISEIKEDWEIVKDYVIDNQNLVFDDEDSVGILNSIYVVNNVSYTQENPFDIFYWLSDWTEDDGITPAIKAVPCVSISDFITYINTVNNTTINKLKLPVFPQYFYSFMKNNYSGSNTEIQTYINSFDFTRFLEIVNNLKTNDLVTYNTYFQEVPDTRIKHTIDDTDEYYHQIYILSAYYGWFLENHANVIMERIEAERQKQSGVDINYKIQYYTGLYNKTISDITALETMSNSLLDLNNFNIVGYIPYDLGVYLFIAHKTLANQSYIINYNEESEQITACNVKWTWNGGTIIGNVCNNLRGQTILNVAEYKDDSIYIPFKSINLSIANYNLDESIYTQTPLIPIINLNFKQYYTKNIPNGVYQFFIRYKIADNVYTDWFPTTNVLFTGNHKKQSTIAGILQYVDTDLDSNNSFVFSVEILNSDAVINYEKFQIGFIVTYDEKTVAKAWKHFSFDTVEVYFDCELEELEDISIDELTSNTYGVYNVKNITAFKNKLYISNYVETNFNKDFRSYAKAINIELATVPYIRTIGNSYYTYNGLIDGNTEVYEGSIQLITNANTGKSYITYIDLPDLIPPYSIDSISVDNIVSQLISSTITHDILNAASENLIQDMEVTYKEWGITAKAIVKAVTEWDTAMVSNKYVGTGRLADKNSNSLAGIKTIIEEACSQISVETGYFTNNEQEVSNNYIEFYYAPDFGTTNETQIVARIRLIFDIDSTKIVVGEYTKTFGTTLIPGQSYNFYIHYVKKSGEITNGYFINRIDVPYRISNDSAVKNHDIIYPKFSSVSVPDEYDYWFISIAHVGGFVSEVYNFGNKTFNLKDSNNVSNPVTAFIGHNMDLDAKLLNVIEDISCDFVINDNGDFTVYSSNDNIYHPSYDSSVGVFFGGSGQLELAIDNQIPINNITNIFIKTPFSRTETDIRLTKCTPVISKDIASYNDYSKCNLLGYICEITKAIKSRLDNTTNIPEDFYDQYYVADQNTIYEKDFSGTTIDTSYPVIGSETSGSRDNNYINKSVVYSNYNLNYLSFALTLQPKIRTYISDDNTVREIICVQNSLEVSDVYELDAMYHNFVQKHYIPYQEKNINVFENTVRSSNALGDESINGVYKFFPEDYYNVPTDKGIIINLASIGNQIVIHTRDSIYNFYGNKSLELTNGSDVSLKEEENAFDSGIAEAFGSELGIYGLKYKRDVLIIPENYIFYDRDSNNIYVYGGQGRIANISESIKKLLNRNNIKDVLLAGDYTNNRFFITVVYVDNGIITLSYNIKAKSFISLHDFTYSNTFNTKTNCYFIKNSDIYVIDKNYVGYGDLSMDDYVYPSYIINENNAAIVDIIINNNIETVKTLNNVSWIVNKVKSFGISQKTEDYNNFMASVIPTSMDETLKDRIQADYNVIQPSSYNPVARVSSKTINRSVYSDKEKANINLLKVLVAEENQNKNYAGDKMRIYTDLCATSLMDISKNSNSFDISDRNSYVYPRFNQGYWSFNYFRDVKNINDIFNYIIKVENDRTNSQRQEDKNNIYRRKENGYPQSNNSESSYGVDNDYRYADNHSLVEGRYFVIRFIFDIVNNFKLENVSLNYDNKL